LLAESVGLLKVTVGILMESVPSDLDIDDVQTQLAKSAGVRDVHCNASAEMAQRIS
jgi:Co/Zn/Cd efflux system component